MRLQKYPNKFNREKSFGLTFSVLFFILALFPLLKADKVNFYLIVIALLFILSTLFAPKVLMLPSKIWLKFGYFLSQVSGPVIMLIMFYLIVTPISIIFKLIRKNLLLKVPQEDTYWTCRDSAGTDMKQQF